MTSEQNKAIVRRFYKAFEQEDLQALNEVLRPTCWRTTPARRTVTSICRASRLECFFQRQPFRDPRADRRRRYGCDPRHPAQPAHQSPVPGHPADGRAV